MTMGGSASVQEQLVQQLLARKLRTSPRQDIPRVPDGQRVRPSPAQAGIWFLTRLFPESTEYNIFPTVSLDFIPSRAGIQAALRTVAERHDALRLRFIEVEGEPMMEDAGPVDPPVTWYDLRDLAEDAASRRVQEIGNATARTRLRPEEPPLLRCSAILLPGDRALLVLVIHHLVCDGWSWSLLHGELTALLSGRHLPSPGETRFIDYAAWLAEAADERRVARDLDYWTRKLGDDLPVLDMPKDRPRPAMPSRAGHTLAFAAPVGAAGALRRLADQEKTTLSAVLLAAYTVFLSRLTHQSDLVVGTFHAGRDHPVTEKMVGCFVNVMALRADLTGAGSFRDVIRRTHAGMTEAQDHLSIAFEQVVAQLRTPRELATHSVFQTSFAVHSADESQPAGAMFLGYGTAKWDLALMMTDSPDGLGGLMECATDLFDRESLERFCEIFSRLLAAMAERPDGPIGSHSLITAAERRRITGELNPYQRPEVGYRTLAGPFEEQVRRAPDAVALIGDEGTLSYAELNRRANRLGRFLRAAGAGPGRHVAVCVERGFGLVTTVYAASKAGAAYVPLEPELPDARLLFMLEDTAPAVVVVDAATRRRVPSGPWRVVDISADAGHWADLPADDLRCDQPGHSLGYLLYTSGSTGRPKAVEYPVDGAIANIQWLQRRYPYGPGDAAILKTSYGFDVCTWELFWPLYNGARLAICPPGAHRDPLHLAGMIELHGVTTVFLVPTMMQAFLDELAPGRCPTLRTALCGGEAVTPRVRDSFHAKVAAELVNCYGPTEAGTVTFLRLDPDEGSPVVPLGRPASNFRLYVLDDDQQVLPIGVPGEAYIGGDVGLAHGYHRRPELTAERFLPDPFGPPGTRIYRTGDVCRYRPDGVLEHLGRVDHQVKIRGMRVELAETEAVLCEHPAVADAVVLALAEAGQALVGWVVAAGDARPDAGTLIDHARRMLPSHMVPGAIVLVPEVPTNVNGKVDRDALLRAWREAGKSAGRRLEPPASEQEAELARAFAQVLDLGEVSVTDSFFDLGGHSLLVFKLLAACERQLGSRPSVADVFAAPTVRDLAGRLAASQDPAREHPNLVPLRPVPAKPLLAFIHGGGGSALPFYEVARHLEQQYSSYALQWSPTAGAGAETPAGAGASIEDLAARYMTALDLVRGLSPLILVGWSMGGCVALEMARAWERQGAGPTALVLLDTWAPPSLLDPAARDAVRATLLRLDLAALEAADRDMAPTREEMAGIQQAFDQNRMAFLRYRPAGYHGAVTLLHAAEPLPATTADLPEAYHQPDRGWGSRLPGLTTRAVTGNHFTIVSPANAYALAEVLREVMAAAMSYAEI